jgi:hypothetical protein
MGRFDGVGRRMDVMFLLTCNGFNGRENHVVHAAGASICLIETLHITITAGVRIWEAHIPDH